MRFCPDHSATDKIFTPKKFKKLWGYAKDDYLERAYGWVPHETLWRLLPEYNVEGHLLLAVKSFYSHSDVGVRFGGVKLQPLTVCVGLRQKCVFSPLTS